MGKFHVTLSGSDLGDMLKIDETQKEFIYQNLKIEEQNALQTPNGSPINAYDLDHNHLYNFALIKRSCRLARRRGVMNWYIRRWGLFVQARGLEAGNIVVFSWIAISHKLGMRLQVNIVVQVDDRLGVLDRIQQQNVIPKMKRTDRTEVPKITGSLGYLVEAVMILESGLTVKRKMWENKVQKIVQCVATSSAKENIEANKSERDNSYHFEMRSLSWRCIETLGLS